MFNAGTSDNQFGNTLRAARVAAGISLRGMADKVGVHYSHLARIESGERPATPDLVARIEDVIASTGNAA